MRYRVGERVDGVINNITKLGIFVTLMGHRFGLVHHSDFGNNWLRQKKRYQVGQKVRVVVRHTYHGRLSLSIQHLNDPKLIDPTNPFSKTKAHDFSKVLTQTVREAKQEMQTLQQILKNDERNDL